MKLLDIVRLYCIVITIAYALMSALALIDDLSIPTTNVLIGIVLTVP